MKLATAQSSNPVGDAYAVSNECYVVTNNVNWQLGAVWFNEPLYLNNSFDITLSVNFGASDNGADGLVFVLQQAGIDAIGIPGGGIGFEGFQPSIGVELDTHQNFEIGDPVEDHMAIMAHGVVNHNSGNNLFGPVPMDIGAANVEDNQSHVFRVTWDPDLDVMEVYFDCELRMTFNADITDVIFQGNDEVFWGFTGATGGLNNVQSVCISEFALGLEDEYTICENEEVQLGVVGTIGGTYEWSPTDYLDNPFIATPVATPPDDIEYTVTFTDLCGEVTELTTDITVNNVEMQVPALTEACDGETVTIEVIGNAESYEWSNDDTGTSTSFNASNNFQVTGTIGECSVTESGEVSFSPVPTVLAWEDNYEVCEGGTITLDATADIPVDYEWNTTDQTASIEVSETGNFTVTVTTPEGCSETYESQVIITPFPDLALPDSVDACLGETILIEANPVAEMYTWSNGDNDFQAFIDTPGWTYLEAANGECSTQDSTFFTFNPAPVFSIQDEVFFCNGEEVWITLPAADYLWEFQGTFVEDSISFNEAGFFNLTATDLEVGCSTVEGIDVTTWDLPEVILPQEAVLCDEGALEIPVSVFGFDSLQWNTGETELNITVADEGWYKLTAFNQCGSDADSVQVVAGRCDCPLFIPNAFTPDLDGINENFSPTIGCDVDDYSLQIYDRWGQIMFQSTTQGEGWNGSGPARTHWLPGGVYVYHLKYEVRLFDGIEVIDEVGHVVLIR